MNSTKIVLIGAGGHAKVVAEAIMASGAYDIVAAIDKNKTTNSYLMNHIPIRSDTTGLTVGNFIVAIGDNQRRRQCFEEFVALGWSPKSIIHSQSIISASVSIGPGVFVGPGAIVHTEARIGANSIVNSGAVVEHDCLVGPHCHIAPGAILGGSVTLGAGAFIGLGSVILPLIEVGDWSVLGAGSTLVRHLESSKTAFGSPAVIKAE